MMIFQGLQFIKKETLSQVVSYEFCEISKNTFFTEHLLETASVSHEPYSAVGKLTVLHLRMVPVKILMWHKNL